jgi:DNA polymerase-3 subunit delta'
MGKEFIARNIAQEITVPAYVTVVLPSEDRKLLHVDDIRELRNDAYSQSYGKCKKVYIIPNADAMSTQSQNAFLKVLEEPPQDCVFILLAENRQNLLTTIRSRCTSLQISRYTDKNISDYLTSLNATFDSETIRLCNGTLNRYEFITSNQFKELEALSDRILLNIRVLHSARIFSITKHVKKLKDYVPDLLDLFLLWYRDMYVYLILGTGDCMDSPSKAEEIKARAKFYTVDEVSEILNQIMLAKMKFAYNSNFDMTLELLLLYMKGDLK